MSECKLYRVFVERGAEPRVVSAPVARESNLYYWIDRKDAGPEFNYQTRFSKDKACLSCWAALERFRKQMLAEQQRVEASRLDIEFKLQWVGENL